jgi:hypothetical protein
MGLGRYARRMVHCLGYVFLGLAQMRLFDTDSWFVEMHNDEESITFCLARVSKNSSIFKGQVTLKGVLHEVVGHETYDAQGEPIIELEFRS